MRFLDVNWYSIFYWLSVADNAKAFFITLMVLFSIGCVISSLCFAFGREEDCTCPKGGMAERAKKWMWYCYPFAIFFWSLFIFTPSKTDTLLIIAGGATGNFLTTDSSSKKIPSDITKFLHMELIKKTESLSDETRTELGLKPKTAKDIFLEKAKDFSKEQLIEYLKSDTTLTK
jgi:hypothetical protein